MGNKRLNYSLVIILLIMFSSCAGNSAKTKQQQENQLALVKANNVINYTNRIIDESNRINDWTKSNERYVNQLISISKNPQLIKDISNISFFTFASMAFPKLSDNKRDEALESITDALEEEDRVFMEVNITEYLKSKNGLYNAYKEVEKYVQEENYKDDKGRLGKQLADSVNIYFHRMNDVMSELVAKAAALGEEAELSTLDSSPLKDVILLMRNQMDLSSYMIAASYAYNEGEFTKEELLEINEKYLSINEENIEKSKRIELSKVQQNNFEAFMKASYEISVAIKKGIRSVNENKKIETISTMEIYYNSLVGKYNDVIK